MFLFITYVDADLPDSSGQVYLHVLLKLWVLGCQAGEVGRLVLVSVPGMHRFVEGHGGWVKHTCRKGKTETSFQACALPVEGTTAPDTSLNVPSYARAYTSTRSLFGQAYLRSRSRSQCLFRKRPSSRSSTPNPGGQDATVKVTPTGGGGRKLESDAQTGLPPRTSMAERAAAFQCLLILPQGLIAPHGGESSEGRGVAARPKSSVVAAKGVCVRCFVLFSVSVKSAHRPEWVIVQMARYMSNK